ncbi:hypothetical protein M427DRAFT_34009 [Gonapodya prolifera JEL478]|uniref:Uncharacterized protein n=1 Tax=Gonapodya prolifera (strain JEL478) TaxID=1344416 RepID=A0A139A9V1_GONPJ|nr:hypothetical protein M427DRAFT_34009 [Gonapodya prolifera JEL478]|eukprot:KXS13434.1 hypothetical protein M427DRAFT_34009 [Gonapodya prolifera JEL478]
MSDKLKPSEFKRSVEVLKEQKEYWAKGCPADTSEDREARERWIQLDAELMAALAGGVSDDVLKKVEEAGTAAAMITTSAQEFNNQFCNLALDIASTGDPLSKIESIGYYLQAIKEVARYIYNHYALQQSSTELEDIMMWFYWSLEALVSPTDGHMAKRTDGVWEGKDYWKQRKGRWKSWKAKLWTPTWCFKSWK